MSLYKTTHTSTRGGVEREWMLEELTDPHLCNIVRKLLGDQDGLDEQQKLHLAECQKEVERRGLDLTYKTGKPPQETGAGPAVQ